MRLSEEELAQLDRAMAAEEHLLPSPLRIW
eukprot:COSAG01_NODE_60873_length_292_cov_0.984456_1_plen_29_part_10